MSLQSMHRINKQNRQEPNKQPQSPSTEELLLMIQQLSSDNQELLLTVQKLSQINSQKNSEIQELLSMEQTLKSKIVQQAELIENLNESDLELKKAEELQKRLKEKEKSWQNELKKYQEEALNANRQAEIAVQKARTEKDQAEKKKAEYDTLIVNEKKKINRKAEELNDHFRKDWQFWFLVIALYAAFATILTGTFSERIKGDCIKAVNTVINAFVWLCDGTDSISGQIAGSIGIPQIIIMIIVDIIVVGIVGLLLFLGGKFVLKLYQEYCFDELGLFITLAIVAVLVWFADSMPLNVVLMLVISQPLHIGIRWYIKDYKENH